MNRLQSSAVEAQWSRGNGCAMGAALAEISVASARTTNAHAAQASRAEIIHVLHACWRRSAPGRDDSTPACRLEALPHSYHPPTSPA